MSYERPTRRDVEAVFASYVDACDTYGLVTPGRRLVLSIGSKTYGNAYRVNEVWQDRERGTGHYAPAIGSDYLGMTAREAHETLCERIRLVHDIVRVIGARGPGASEVTR